MTQPRVPRAPRQRATPSAPVTPTPAPAAPPNQRQRARARRASLSGLVQASYRDDDGRMWAVMVPPGREDDAEMGVILGPPDLSPLGLPAPVMVRLHNELHGRGIFSLEDAKRRPVDIFAALQAAYRVDVAAVQGLYAAGDVEAGE